MKLNLESTMSVGSIKFGMSENDIVQILGTDYKSFTRNPSVQYTEYAYDDLGLYVSFDQNMKCNAVLIFPKNELMLNGKNLFEMTGKEISEMMRQADKGSRTENESIISQKLGISVYLPDLDGEPEEKPQSILVFSEKYYG